MSNYTILDNGAAEGTAYSWNALAVFTEQWDVDEVVLPDKLGDAEFSIANAIDAGKLAAPLINRDIQLMAVAQGRTMAEIMKCIYAYSMMEHISVIGLPRILNQSFQATSRLRLAEAMAKDPDLHHLEVHCLGAYYPFPKEVQELAQLPNVRSMDTSMPWVYGMAGLSLSNPGKADSLKRVDNYFEAELTHGQRRKCEQNVDTILSWAKAPRR